MNQLIIIEEYGGLNNMNEIAVIDIETTGFSHTSDYILEIGIIKLDLDTGNKTILMNYVCHETGITEEKIRRSWIISNSSLTIEQVRYSINLKYLLLNIQRIVKLYPTTAYNRRFDIEFLEARGIIFHGLHPCPMLELTPIMKLPAKRSSGYKWPNVQEAYNYFFPDNDYVELHRGADDALHEADIIYELNKFKTNGK